MLLLLGPYLNATKTIKNNQKYLFNVIMPFKNDQNCLYGATAPR